MSIKDECFADAIRIEYQFKMQYFIHFLLKTIWVGATENEKKDFLSKINPNGRIPALETPEGNLFESHAIIRHLARSSKTAQLYGSTVFEQSLVDQWVDFSMSQLEPAAEAYMLPYLGYIPYAKSYHEKASGDLKKFIHVLEKRIKDNGTGFIVGGKITIADVTVAAALQPCFQFTWDEKYRKTIANVTKLYQTISNNSSWTQVNRARAYLSRENLDG